MPRFLVFVALFLLAPLFARADCPAAGPTDAVLSWEAPIQNDDNTPLTNLKGFKPYHGSSPSTLAPVVSLNDPSLRCWTMPDLSPGPHYFALMAYTQTEESRLSEVVTKTIEAPPPPPPPVFATVSTTVFMELQTPTGFGFLAVGTIPIGTPCDKTQRVNDFFMVPVTAVTFTTKITRLVALAACQ